MDILIAERNPDLGRIWAQHLERQDAQVTLVSDRDSAIVVLSDRTPALVVISLSLGEGEALSVADYTAYRHPDTKVIFVSQSSFFSDGSIFEHSANACACLPQDTAPQDLATLVRYHLGSAA